MIYRSYEEKDFYNGLSKILLQGFNSHISKETLEAQCIGDSKNIIIAFDGDKSVVAGCLIWEVRIDYVRSHRTLFVAYLAVDSVYRRKGIGTALHYKVEEICKMMSCSSIELTSANFRKDAHKFYLSLGYTVKDTSVFIKEIN